eukprot:TRINITY_DN16934_c0_g1_i1.p1 TRINITY_DN16934_c0_g1~~TRINITY_DN16934_c0_g1_i1.p1  ORF type:complete len:299 (+),score=45.81 TRINITY_DN16934_c0_g1_i1:55-951(+)
MNVRSRRSRVHGPSSMQQFKATFFILLLAGQDVSQVAMAARPAGPSKSPSLQEWVRGGGTEIAMMQKESQEQETEDSLNKTSNVCPVTKAIEVLGAYNDMTFSSYHGEDPRTYADIFKKKSNELIVAIATPPGLATCSDEQKHDIFITFQSMQLTLKAQLPECYEQLADAVPAEMEDGTQNKVANAMTSPQCNPASDQQGGSLLQTGMAPIGVAVLACITFMIFGGAIICTIVTEIWGVIGGLIACLLETLVKKIVKFWDNTFDEGRDFLECWSDYVSAGNRFVGKQCWSRRMLIGGR